MRVSRDLTDLAGHASYVLLASGLFLISRGHKIGWLLRAFGEIGWLVIGFVLGMSSIWGWGLAFVALDLNAYFRKEKTQ